MKTIFRNSLVSLALWLVSAAALQAQPLGSLEKTLRVFDWNDAKPAGSEILTTNGMTVLKIQNTNGMPMEVTLLTIDNPLLIAKANAVYCEIKCEDVKARRVEERTINGSSWNATEVGHLFLYEHIPPQVPGGDETTNHQGFYFADSDNWKPDQFSIGSPVGYPSPTQLKLNLYMPTNGIVYLRQIKLIGIPSSSNWWTSQQAGLIGGIGGTVIGCLGAMTGILGSKGRARGLVLGTVKCCIALGLIMLAGGVTALVLKQPYEVYYPLLLGGFILTIVFSVNLPAIHRRYDELEIRRMASEDAMRG